MNELVDPLVRLLYAPARPVRFGRRWYAGACEDSDVMGSGCFYPTPRHLAYLDAYKTLLSQRKHPSLAAIGHLLGVTRQTVWQQEQHRRFRQWLRTELATWRAGSDGNTTEGWDFNPETTLKGYRFAGRPLRRRSPKAVRPARHPGGGGRPRRQKRDTGC
jgi:hypothetical protein